MKSLAVAFAAACLVAALPVLAADPTPAPPAAAGSPVPSPVPSPTPRAWVTTGFVDTTYSAVATSRSFQFASGSNARVFDLYDRQPTLNALNLQLIHNAPIGGKIELTLGSDADVLASWPTANFSSFDVTNAYLSATSGAFTLIAGKFSTLAGAEVLESPGNAGISRSILFGYAIPFTHTGARLTYAATSALSAIAGINNGWDNTKGNGSGAKTVEGGLAYANKNLNLTTQGYSGTEQTAYGYHGSVVDVNGIGDNWSGVTGRRRLIDAVATYKAGPVATFGANYDSGSQENATLLDGTGAPQRDGAGIPLTGTATWNGAAGYAGAALSPKLTLSGRYEYLRDASGYRTGYAQRWSEGTLTLGYAPSAPLLFRLEARADHSDRNVWLDRSGNSVARLSSLAAEAIVKF